ncbi:hypothetical protein AMJ52_09220 [candidate division TA06 bacterium DG_78]|uniref:Uncharacterized protein n=1 Tax=candidate division TA06 bacterium DG_78 TaxID=1703772 RepID=A0A0S7Y8K2_UNCT6|nr:MAG: hypothetical protein AMJ52_09220 [candidate division TA06 bacterium DG_78]
MKKIILLIIFLSPLILSAQIKTIKADVTNDGYNDRIEMGLKSVVVTDLISCCTRRKYTVVDNVENLADIMVDDFHSGAWGNEIAVVTLPNHEYVTQVYGLKGKNVNSLSDPLPGQISFDENEQLFGYKTHTWQGREIQIPWPIIEDAGFLKPALLVQEVETTIVVDTGTTKEIVIEMFTNVFTVVVADTKKKDAVIFLLDNDGTLITQRPIDSEHPMVGTRSADLGKTISLVIDNLQSSTSTTVHYIIKHYIKKLLSIEIRTPER